MSLNPIPIIGTVKLHGIHAYIIIASDNTITLQSRNNARLFETADTLGFATAMSKKHLTILGLRNQFVSRWRKLNPSLDPDVRLPVTIAGEWIGENI